MENWEYDGESSEETSWSTSSPEKDSSINSMEDSRSGTDSEVDGEASTSKSDWSDSSAKSKGGSGKNTRLQSSTEDSENDGESAQRSNWNCTPDKQASLCVNISIAKEKHPVKSKTPRSLTTARSEKGVLSEPNDIEQDSKRKRKRKHRPVTICLTNCRYDIVRSVATSFGLKVIQDTDNWNIYWTDFSVSLDRAMDLKRYQVVNHFPGMNEICRKDLLARNLNRMKKMFHKDYDIFPRTWSLPADLGDLQMFHATHKNRTYICKPEMGCQGRGIFLIRNIRDLNPFGKIICQLYIQKPFLIDDLKFDLRIYVLITSCDPLRIYFYNEGLARFATAKYKLPSNNNTENSYMHLTNYAVNKFSRDFVPDDAENGSKRKYTSVLNWLQDRNYNVGTIEKQIEDVIIKTIITAQPILKHNYKTCFPTHDVCSACFEILGFDIILDMNLKPWVLEVNHSPSFHTDSVIDREIKENLLRDTFAMFNLKLLDRRKILGEDRKRVIQRLQQDRKDSPPDLEPPKTASRKEKKVNWELAPVGGYRLIYPSSGFADYDKFFNQNLGSIYQATASSNARVNHTKSQLDNYHTKKTTEENKRMPPKAGLKDKVLQEKESATEVEKDKKLQNLNKQLKFPLVTNIVGSSFKPHYIVAEEELDRLKAMMQRGLMIRNMGVEVYIYRLLTDMGIMKSKDEKVFRRLHGMKNSTHQLHLKVSTSETNIKTDANNNVIAPKPSPLPSQYSSALISEQPTQANTPRGTHTISTSSNQMIINDVPSMNRKPREDLKKSLDSYNISLHCTNLDFNRNQQGAKTYRYNPYGPRTANIFKENTLFSGPSIKNLSLGSEPPSSFVNFPTSMRVQQQMKFTSNENVQYAPGISPNPKRTVSDAQRSFANKRSHLTTESYNSGHAINTSTSRVMNTPEGVNANPADLYTATSIGDQLTAKQRSGMKVQHPNVPQPRQAVSATATASPAQWSVERGYYYKHIPAVYNNNLISSLRAPYLASEVRQSFNTTTGFGGEGYNHYVKSSGNAETGRPSSGRVLDDKTVSAFGIETAGIVLPRNVKSKRSSNILTQTHPKTLVAPDAPGPMRVTQMFFDSKGIVQPRKPDTPTHVKSARASYDLLSAEILQARNIKTARSGETERIPYSMPQSGRKAPKTSSDSRIYSITTTPENMRLLQNGNRFPTPPKVGN